MEPVQIRRLRHALGWTQRDLAAHAGVSQPLVSAWESGARRPSGPALRLLEELAVGVGDDLRPELQRREHILRAASAIIAREGLADLNFARIGQEVGLTRSGVEHHFPTRDTLIEALLLRVAEVFDDDLLRREATHRDLGHPHPTLAAYLDQGLLPTEGAPAPHVQRAAMLASLVTGGDVHERARRWYTKHFREALDDGPFEARATVALIMLGVDAIWLLALLGWMDLDDLDAPEIASTARDLMARAIQGASDR